MVGMVGVLSATIAETQAARARPSRAVRIRLSVFSVR